MASATVFRSRNVLFRAGLPFSYITLITENGDNTEYKVFSIDMINKRIIHFGIKNKDIFNNSDDFNAHFPELEEKSENIGRELIGAIIIESQISILCVKEAFVSYSNNLVDANPCIYNISEVEEKSYSFFGYSSPKKLFSNFPFSDHFIFSYSDISRCFHPGLTRTIDCWNEELKVPFGDSGVCISIYEGMCKNIKLNVDTILRKLGERNWLYEIISRERTFSITRMLDPSAGNTILINHDERTNTHTISGRDYERMRSEVPETLDHPITLISKECTIDVDIFALLIAEKVIYSITKSHRNDRDIHEAFIKFTEFIYRMDTGARPKDFDSLLYFEKNFNQSSDYVKEKTWKEVKEFIGNLRQFKGDKFFLNHQYIFDVYSNWNFQTQRRITKDSNMLLIRLPLELNVKGLNFLIPKQTINEPIEMSVSIGNDEKSMKYFLEDLPIGEINEKSWMCFNFYRIEKTSLLYPSTGRASSGLFIKIEFNINATSELLIDALFVEVSECVERRYYALKSGKEKIGEYALDHRSIANVINFSNYCFERDVGLKAQVEYIAKNMLKDEQENPAFFILKCYGNVFRSRPKNECAVCKKKSDRLLNLESNFLFLRESELAIGDINICRDCLPILPNFDVGKVQRITQENLKFAYNDKPVLFSYPPKCKGDPSALFSGAACEFTLDPSEEEKAFRIVFSTEIHLTQLQINVARITEDDAIIESRGGTVSIGDGQIRVAYDHGETRSFVDFSIRNMHNEIVINSMSVESEGTESAPLQLRTDVHIEFPLEKPFMHQNINLNPISFDLKNWRRVEGIKLKGNFFHPISFCAIVVNSNQICKMYIAAVIPVMSAHEINYTLRRRMVDGDIEPFDGSTEDNEGTLKIFFLNCSENLIKVSLQFN